MIEISPTQPFGAVIEGIDLTRPISAADVDAIRSAFAEHHVLVFPDQPMDDDDLERFSLYMGDLGEDPWFPPIEGRKYIAELCRAADETSPIFAEGWHSDWSFLEKPPMATCLLGLEIPPEGGDTLFADQHLAYASLPDDLRAQVDALTAKHTTNGIYGAGGIYDGGRDEEQSRTMKIVQSDAPAMTGEHPFVRMHEENGQPALFSTLGYVQGFVGVEPAEAFALLKEIQRYQTAEEVTLRHRWAPNMLVMWDNRSVLHRATGGYDGYARVLHRTTVMARAAE